ncbi:hypothetical protein BJ508DRAFT_228170 [Ascobolus immersus RN42]|uniref:Sas10 C-terminal domain-containing protein n=1 Tax=Ascobolus immersus RN42 TaxID=1160509 RepID=A0A3N4HZM8_ASCIM|nr:hypothetical protein BJ508DRAFT_228170 [Ascobolus immersus RN42]
MAKKGGRTKKTEEKGARGVREEENKLRVDRWEDVADDVDKFHMERDKIMLDGSDDDNEEEDILSDQEEVLGVDYADSDDSDDDEEDDEEEQDDGKAAQDDSDDEEIIRGKKRGEEDEDVEGWGQDKKNYYGGNDIQTEEDALEEEKEARRIQAEKLKGMREEDFFDADEWAGVKTTETGGKKKKGEKKIVKEDLPTELPEDPEARLKVLKARHPEFEPLAKDFLELQELHGQLGRSAAAADAIQEGSSIELVKFRALSAYLGVLGVYFAVVTSEEAMKTGGRAVREHGVMEGLVKARQIWESVKDLVVEEIGGTPEREARPDEMALDRLDSSDEEGEPTPSDSEEEIVPVKKSKKSTKPLASLLPSRIRPSKSTTKDSIRPTTKSTSDFGDSLPSVNTDLVSSRRRALNFHASQLHSKSTKRNRAVVGGDSDIPYKERAKEKEARLQAEALRKRELLSRDADLGDSDPEDDTPNNKRKAGSDDEDYYDFIANASKRKKEEGKQAYDRARDLVRGDIVKDVEGEAGDKRAINYQISKNKGLTPHRKKEVRNPRVKKRMKFEKAKKKLGSTRAVYKTPTSAYGGEMTGIKSGLVKSRKLA